MIIGGVMLRILGSVGIALWWIWAPLCIIFLAVGIGNLALHNEHWFRYVLISAFSFTCIVAAILACLMDAV